MIALDNFNNYFFCYHYLYYFFVAKYLAEHTEETKEVTNNIINNLQKDENAYIAIFVSHHSSNSDILDEIVHNTLGLFDGCEPASLSNDELSFFNEKVGTIINPVLPSTSTTPEMERNNRLSAQNDHEQKNSNDIAIEEDDAFAIDLRRSIKTVEVIGRIIKNRAGSLDKSRLQSMFEEAMNVHLRILSFFFKIIKQENEQQEIIRFISNRLKLIMGEKSEVRRKEGKRERTLSKEELGKMSETIFWNLNFLTVYGFMNKIIHSLGSNKLTQIIEAVCDEKDTPASFLVKHGILMWYNKNLQVENIATKIRKDGFSDITKKIINLMIVNHCSMHQIDYKEKQKIEQKFGISSKKLLECTIKKK